MHKTLKVGVIGVGYLGRFHAQKYAAMQDVELVGVADAQPKQAQAVAAECGTRALDNYQALLPLVDAVSIVVPTSLHHQVAQDCLRQGVDIMVEKPITTTLAEADDLISLAHKQQRIIQVGHLERFNPAFLAAQSLIRPPRCIEAQRVAVFKERGTDVDVVLDLMIHDIDLILALVQSPLVALQASGTAVVTAFNDMASACLSFANGCTATITVSRVSFDTMRRMRLFAPGSALSIDFGSKEIMTLQGQTDNISGKPVLTSEKISAPNQDALELELCAFVQHVRTRSRPVVSGEEGRLALDVALQVIEGIEGIGKHPASCKKI